MRWVSAFSIILGVTACGPLGEPVDRPEQSCLTQCEVWARECPEKPLESFVDYETRIEGMSPATTPCPKGTRRIGVGTCNDGSLYIEEPGAYVSRLWVYDSDTKQFRATSVQSDLIDGPCHGRSYWPEDVQCWPRNPVKDHCEP